MPDPREEEIERLRKALRDIHETLRVPAAEFVPAIRDAWDQIDAALGLPHWTSRDPKVSA